MGTEASQPTKEWVPRHKRRELLRKVVLPTIDGASSKTQKSLLRELAEYCEKDGKCFPSLKKLASDCGCGQRTVQRGLDALEVQGFIVRKKRDRSGNRGATSNEYSIYWQKLAAFTPDQVAMVASCSTPDQVAMVTDQVAMVSRSSGHGDRSSGHGGYPLENRSENRSETTTTEDWVVVVSLLESFGVGQAKAATERARQRGRTVEQVLEQLSTLEGEEPGVIYNQVCTPTPKPKPVTKPLTIKPHEQVVWTKAFLSLKESLGRIPKDFEVKALIDGRAKANEIQVSA